MDNFFSNVRCYSSGNKLLLPTFGTETLRIVLSSADFDLLLDYKCIWFLLTDRWGLEPETGDLEPGSSSSSNDRRAAGDSSSDVCWTAGGISEDDCRAAGSRCGHTVRNWRFQGRAAECSSNDSRPQGTAVRTFGKETPAEIGDDETIICSKLVEMKGSSSQLVMNIGGRALTLVRSQPAWSNRPSEEADSLFRCFRDVG